MIEAIASAPFLAYTEDAPPGLVGTIGVEIRDPQDNVVVAHTTANITEVGVATGVYQWSTHAPAIPGPYVVVWDDGSGNFATELMQVTPGSAYVPSGDVTTVSDLTDLAVLIPWARRAMEGPYGAPPDKPTLLDSVIYPMLADACSEIILLSGSLFGHDLNVTARDPLAGYPTQWKTNAVLNQWEGAIVISQVAIDYWRFFFRDTKTSQTIQNEGTMWEYTLSANVIRDYLSQLVDARDKGIDGLRAHNIVLDRYASNIRLRDQATVAVLEWWDTVSPGLSGGGMPGGQEMGVIPWTPGWSGPGFTP